MGESKTPYLTEEQADAVVQFSQGLWAIDRYGIYTPYMQNQLLNNLNNNSKIPSIEKVEKALADYKNSADSLQGYTEFMEKFDMIFERTVKYYANMLSFDLEVIPIDAFGDDFKSKDYSDDKDRINRFLDSFDYKSEFRKMVTGMLRHETVFTWFRKTKWGNKGLKCALQVMPQKFCLITGYWDKGLLYDSY